MTEVRGSSGRAVVAVVAVVVLMVVLALVLDNVLVLVVLDPPATQLADPVRNVVQQPVPVLVD